MRHSILFAVLWITFAGCLSAGTHGSIKSYSYAVSKRELEKAVREVLRSTPSIKQDSLKDYYNDDTTYITMQISEPGLKNSYTIRYYGGRDYWDTARASGIFIAYAYDAKNNGGSEGNGGVPWYKSGLRKRLLEPFERQFISGLDKQLGMKHRDEN